MKGMIVLLLSIAATFANAQVGLDADRVIGRLKSSEMVERTLAARELVGAGVKNPEVYAQVALNIESALTGLKSDSPRLDEIAWHLKAVASSGDLKFMPLIKRAEDSGIRKLKKHARAAREILETAARQGGPYLDYTKVPILTEKQAEKCEIVAQENCKTSRAAEKCVSHHQNNAVKMGANAIMLVHSSSRSVGFGPFGGDSTMIANYLRCP